MEPFYLGLYHMKLSTSVGHLLHHGRCEKPTHKCACTCKIFSTIINLFVRPIIDMDKQWKPFKLYCSCWSLILWEKKCSGPHTKWYWKVVTGSPPVLVYSEMVGSWLEGCGGWSTPVKKSLQSKDSKPTTYQTIR